jgi:hypothetical protein
LKFEKALKTFLIKNSYLCGEILKRKKIMESATLDKRTSDKVSFISFIIPEFAAAYTVDLK